MAVVGTAIAVPSYTLLRLLGRWATPPASSRPPASDGRPVPPPRGRHLRSVRFIAFFLTAYRRSYLHAYLHRDRGKCRFVPCCAEYFLLAVEKYGLVRGIRLTGSRIARCTPAYRGDYLDFP
jgi:putative component of membrane protein insertase Oxa1/YidC/SpoIIIJ protein YidD